MPVTSNRRAQAAAHLESGLKALAAGSIPAARASLQAAVALEPSWAEPRYQLARVHHAAGDPALAEQTLRAAREADPRHAASTHMLGTVLCDREAFVEALPLLREAAALEPDQAEFQRDLGVLQLFIGDIAAARANLHRALELDPHVKDILPTLVRMTRMDSGAEDAERLFDLTRTLAGRMEELPRGEQVRVNYALGKALEDRGDYDAAFAAFAKANAMHRQAVAYDGQAFEARFQAIADAFNPALFERLKREGVGAQSDRPIFIVGMPRSGTTLVEQIISAHPDVNGAGEIDLLHRLVIESNGPGGSKFPAWVPTMNGADLQTIGQAILDALPPGLPGQSRQTIKRLENFQYLGLIHLCLPNATIINCRRDPRDSGFSAFAMLFLEEQGFTYDLAELGHHWRIYDRMMAHWMSVLPPGRVLEAPYEGVVADLEGWTHRLLEHCKLDWDDACLRYYESKRLVRSASFAQVREPIYTSSLDRWRPFERHLRPMFEAMGEPWASGDVEWDGTRARRRESPARAAGT
ncbi:MAG TPA: sulfotransferase [Caulobacteraceae bacterium]|jgi:Tfp pilus assembly protein PilF|nr:sulfotransferase [Caulobacteraceae bacterium]